MLATCICADANVMIQVPALARAARSRRTRHHDLMSDVCAAPAIRVEPLVQVSRNPSIHENMIIYRTVQCLYTQMDSSCPRCEHLNVSTALTASETSSPCRRPHLRTQKKTDPSLDQQPLTATSHPTWTGTAFTSHAEREDWSLGFGSSDTVQIKRRCSKQMR